MPRPLKPIELHHASGTYRAHRHAERAAAPKSELPIGEPPGHLAPAEAAAWREFVANCPADVLTSNDRWTLEACCRLMARSRATDLLPAELGHLRALLSELGASPASRGKVQGARPAAAPAASPWDVPGPARN
jgi:phage terminase small subunit